MMCLYAAKHNVPKIGTNIAVIQVSSRSCWCWVFYAIWGVLGGCQIAVEILVRYDLSLSCRYVLPIRRSSAYAGLSLKFCTERGGKKINLDWLVPHTHHHLIHIIISIFILNLIFLTGWEEKGWAGQAGSEKPSQVPPLFPKHTSSNKWHINTNPKKMTCIFWGTCFLPTFICKHTIVFFTDVPPI